MTKKKDRLIQVRAPAELATQALAEASREDVSLSYRVRELLKEWLKSKKQSK